VSVTAPTNAPARPMRIAVVDTGVAMNHPMLDGKLIFEAGAYLAGCSGTNSNRFLFRSRCRGAPPPPSQPGGVAGSFGAQGDMQDGAPPLSDAFCVNRTGGVSVCDHGTLVASIAAGKSVTTTNRPGVGGEVGSITLSGVAPAAQIVPVAAASWHIAGTEAPVYYSEDLLVILQTIASISPAGVDLNDWIVNLSIGGLPPPPDPIAFTGYSAPCLTGPAGIYGIQTSPPQSGPPTNEAFVLAVQLLLQRGVPVIISAGNNNFQNALTWPACLPGTVKVSSTVNPGSLDLSVHEVSQVIANKVSIGSAHNADKFFVAPGGRESRQYFGTIFAAEANVNNGLFALNAGTSFAAPHVAGAYAVVKAGYRRLGLGWSVSGGSDYLYDTASRDAPWYDIDAPIPDPNNPGAFLPNRSFRSIRFVPPPTP
jgi:hypothetical protein